ncbi:MAG: DNA polymerase III subunit delta [Aquincola sp.]|nr:DNA polymerase III subunit delta [Aquincola sp.]MDH5331896.1 DNA polymerase III subunit delta [Aquincola sp.]
MQVKPEQLAAHLEKGLRPLYTIHGDEPLLAQEAGDALRAAARGAGYGERKVFTVGNAAHFDWDGFVGASQAMSLFAERQLIELRLPNGKPGKEGSEALQRYCDSLSDDVVTLIHLPKLDFQQIKSGWFTALDAAGVMVKVDAVERRELPAWIARRLAAQGQRVAEGEAGQHTLAFFADRVEGNLLAAHQELQKLGLLYPPGELSFEQVEAAVLNVARYDVFKLGEAVLAGQVGRALRMLEGLEAEGEAAVLVHWSLAEDIRALKRIKDAMADGRPMPLALREARVWGVKERLFERVLPLLADHQLAHLVQAASVCDGVIKGLKHPEWPLDAWSALKRLALLTMQHLATTSAPRGAPPVRLQLALQA